jgi:N,N'-diacetyllegionaminate synthase
MKKISFGERFIGKGEPILVIAEIGINHEGDVKICEDMIQAAAESGADSIKLQTVDADANYVRGTESHKLFKKAALTRDETAQMFELSRKLKMEPFTTAGDFKTLDWVDELEPAAHKISSGLLTNLPIIKHVASKERPILFSTGVAIPKEIRKALDVSIAAGAKEFGIFQCTSLYPTPNDELHLSMIHALEKEYALPIGFSDHSLGIDGAVLSIAAGAAMVEKHFTIDTLRESYDHFISLTPESLSQMVRKIRSVEVMMGKPEKFLNNEIQSKRDFLQRCLVAGEKVQKGDIFTRKNLTMKRPLPGIRGLEPEAYESVLGCKATRSLCVDEIITSECYQLRRLEV